MKFKYITEALGDLLMIFFPVLIYVMLFVLHLVGGDIDYISADMAVVSMIMFSEPLPKLVKIRDSSFSQVTIAIALIAIVFCTVLFLVEFFESNGNPILLAKADASFGWYVNNSINISILVGAAFNFMTKVYYYKEMDKESLGF
ncbi:MAG: hypothetical protein ACYC1J_10025 [Acidithiobacillus ferrooxidans]